MLYNPGPESINLLSPLSHPGRAQEAELEHATFADKAFVAVIRVIGPTKREERAANGRDLCREILDVVIRAKHAETPCVV